MLSFLSFDAKFGNGGLRFDVCSAPLRQATVVIGAIRRTRVRDPLGLLEAAAEAFSTSNSSWQD